MGQHQVITQAGHPHIRRQDARPEAELVHIPRRRRRLGDGVAPVTELEAVNVVVSAAPQNVVPRATVKHRVTGQCSRPEGVVACAADQFVASPVITEGRGVGEDVIVAIVGIQQIVTVTTVQNVVAPSTAEPVTPAETVQGVVHVRAAQGVAGRCAAHHQRRRRQRRGIPHRAVGKTDGLDTPCGGRKSRCAGKPVPHCHLVGAIGVGEIQVIVIAPHPDVARCDARAKLKHVVATRQRTDLGLGDPVLLVTQVETVGVSVATANGRVTTFAAFEIVVCGIPRGAHPVVAVAAEQLVVAGFITVCAHDHDVVALATVQDVAASTTAQVVVAGQAPQCVVHRRTDHDIVAGCPVHHQCHRRQGSSVPAAVVGKLNPFDPVVGLGEPRLHGHLVRAIAVRENHVVAQARGTDVGWGNARPEHQPVTGTIHRRDFGDVVPPVTERKVVGVVVRAAAQGVVARATLEPVACGQPVRTEGVVAGSAKQLVAAGATVGKQLVVAVATVQHIRTAATPDQVVAAQPADGVVLGAASQCVIASSAQNQRVGDVDANPSASREAIHVRAPQDQLGASHLRCRGGACQRSCCGIERQPGWQIRTVRTAQAVTHRIPRILVHDGVGCNRVGEGLSNTRLQRRHHQGCGGAVVRCGAGHHRLDRGLAPDKPTGKRDLVDLVVGHA